MDLTQLIYASRPFGYDDLALGGILATARRNNTRDRITGALICREDLYLQLLDGPPLAVAAAYERIKRDDRHAEITLLSNGKIQDRLFPTWAMRHDPARSWMWSASEVDAGAIAAATQDEARAIFVRLAAEPAADVASSGCPISSGRDA